MRRLIVLGLVVALVTVMSAPAALFAMGGGNGGNGGNGGCDKNKSSSKCEYKKKQTICHKGKTIRVSVNAVPAHLAHGDETGPCKKHHDKKHHDKKHHDKKHHGKKHHGKKHHGKKH